MFVWQMEYSVAKSIQCEAPNDAMREACAELVLQLKSTGVKPPLVALVQVYLERLHLRPGTGISELSGVCAAIRMAERRTHPVYVRGLRHDGGFFGPRSNKSPQPERVHADSQARGGGGAPARTPPCDLYIDPHAEREDLAGHSRAHVTPSRTVEGDLGPRGTPEEQGRLLRESTRAKGDDPVESVLDIVLPEYVQSPAYLSHAEQTYADLGPIVLPRRDTSRDDAVAMAEGLLKLLPKDAWMEEVYQSDTVLRRAKKHGYLKPEVLRTWVAAWGISLEDAARVLRHRQETVAKRYAQKNGYLPGKLSEALEAVRHRDKWDVLRESYGAPGPERHIFFKVLPSVAPSALKQAMTYGLWPPELRYYRHWSKKQCRLMELRIIARETRGPMPLGKRAELTKLERWCRNSQALRPSGCFIVHTPSGLSAGCQGRGQFERNRQLTEATLSRAVTRWRILEEKHEKFSQPPTDFDLVKSQLAAKVAADGRRESSHADRSPAETA